MKIADPANFNLSATQSGEKPPAESPQEICLSHALQSVYGDILLVDFDKNTCRQLYHGDGHFTRLPLDLSLAETLRHELAERVHPDDAQRYAAFFTPGGLRQMLAQTPLFTAADVRKKALDGSYRWDDAIVSTTSTVSLVSSL